MPPDLIELIYEAALKPDHWADFLGQTAYRFSSGTTVLAIHDRYNRSSKLNLAHGADAALRHDYESHYAALNPWMPNGRGLVDGFVGHGQDLFPQSQLEKTEFYNDFGLRRGIAFTMGCAIQVFGNAVLYLSVNRGVHNGTFSEEDTRELALLVPHLRKAIQIQERLQEAARYQLCAGILPFGVLQITPDLKIVECNGKAEELLADGKFLRVSYGALRITRPGLQRSFERFLKVANIGPGHEKEAPLLYRIPCSSGQGALSVLAVPQPVNGLLSIRNSITLLLLDPDNYKSASLSKLISLFGFTPAEAKLALELLQAKTLVAAAAALGISRNTAKSQLAAIFAKTETRSQAELLRILLSGPLQLRLDHDHISVVNSAVLD